MEYLGPYALGPNETQWQGIYTGDNRVLMQSIPDASVDLIVTSPPYDGLRKYNGKWSFDFEAVAAQAYRILKPGGVMVWVVGDATENGSETLTSMRQAIHFVDVCGFKMHDTMIYEAAGTGAKGSNYAYWQAFEYMFVLVKGEIKTVNRIADVRNTHAGQRSGGRFREGGTREKYHETNVTGVRTNIWRYPVGFANGSDKTGHPAPFPERLAADHILTWSNPGDVVVDFFMGAGTTAKMCKLHGRHWWGCDVSQEYAELARNRVRNTAQPLFVMDAPKADAPKQLSLIA